MREKTESDMLEVALRLVNEDENARVVFFIPSWPRAKMLFKTVEDNLTLYDGAEIQTFGMLYTAKNGATLRIRGITEETLPEIGGLMVTHAFHSQDLYGKCWYAILGRVRSTKKHKMESGTYGPYGAVVYKDY